MGIGVFLLSALICLPFIAYVPWIGDEGILLHGSREMLSGSRIYADFFEFHPPLGFLIVEAWTRVAGASITSIRLLSIATVATIALLTYLCCVRVSGRAWASAALALAWVGCSQGALTQVNHHYFTTAFSMASLLAIVGPRAPAAGWAGLFAGAAGMTTPTRGALAVLAALVSLGRRWRSWPIFVAAVAAVPVACTVYLLWLGVFPQAFHDVIVWTAARYSSIQGVPFGARASGQHLPLLLVYPLALAVLIFLLVRRDAELKDRLVTPVAFALCGVLGCYPRPDDWHLAFAAPLVLPLLALGWDRLAPSSGKVRAGIAAALALALLPATVGYGRTVKQALLGQKVETRAGVVTFGEQETDPLVRGLASLPRTDHFFFYPYMPLLPVLTGRDHVATVDVFTPNYTTADQYDGACRTVMRTADWVVFDRLWSDPKFLRGAFPAMRDPTSPESRRFETALARGFAPAADYGRFVLMKRASAGEALCDAPQVGEGSRGR
jgi:hypothetical protein